MTRISPTTRKRQRREEAARLEAKRQSILASMDAEARAEHEDDDVVTLIVLRQTGQLNMLPGTQDLG